MTQAKTVNINRRAYFKAIFHAAKFTQNEVNGVFTGRFSDNTLYIEDAYPLFHSQITLTPLLESALMAIESVLSLKKDEQQQQQIVGYYFANEHVNNESMSGFHQSIASKIHSQCENRSVVFMIDNYRLEPMQTESRFAMNQFVLDGNKWKLSELQTKITWANNKEQNVLQNTIFTDLKNEMERGAFQKVVDFEEHVDHLPLNFTNPEII